MDSSGTPYASLLGRLDRDPASPFVTDVDLATGERVELSVASAANGAAKAAHLLSGLAAELGTAPRVRLRLPLHWQVVTFALGAWAAGASLVTGSDTGRAGDADAVVLGPDEAEDPPDDLPDLVWATRLHPFGLPFAAAPSYPVEDLTPALREQPDSPPRDVGGLGAVAVIVDGVASTTADLLARATALGAAVADDARVLSCLPWTTTDGWVCGVVLPALAARSVVLARGLTPDPAGESALVRLCTAERVGATAGVDVAGLPRLC